jgi:hypothetical protein
MSDKTKDRRYFIGGSDANIIIGDNQNGLIRLWQEKRGEIKPEDLSTNLVVQLGRVTEHDHLMTAVGLKPMPIQMRSSIARPGTARSPRTTQRADHSLALPLRNVGLWRDRLPVFSFVSTASSGRRDLSRHRHSQ